MGEQGSARAVTLLGVNFVCAHAGDEIKRTANTSFFISFSREICAISALLNWIGQKKSTTLLASSRQQSSRSPADYLIEKSF
jgi:hypothetical protein